MDKAPLVAWIQTRGGFVRVMNAVKAADFPVQEQFCRNTELDEFWGGPAAVLQLNVRTSWSDAVAYAEQRLATVLKHVGATDLTLIFSDHAPGSQSDAEYRWFHLPDARRSDWPQALQGISPIADGVRAGGFTWDHALLRWVGADGDSAEAGVTAPIRPEPPTLADGAEAETPTD